MRKDRRCTRPENGENENLIRRPEIGKRPKMKKIDGLILHVTANMDLPECDGVVQVVALLVIRTVSLNRLGVPAIFI